MRTLALFSVLPASFLLGCDELAIQGQCGMDSAPYDDTFEDTDDSYVDCGTEGAEPAAVLPNITTTGMTWALGNYNAKLDVTMMSCYGDSVNYGACDAYNGDLSCRDSAPILCFYDSGDPNPGISVDFYHGWSGGEIAITPPVRGVEMTSLAAATLMCEAYFGVGWRMAEFHDGGGGWAWFAYGHIDTNERVWVYIDDQNANCWNN